MEGFSTPTTHGKWSLRASATGELVFDNVESAKRKYSAKGQWIKRPFKLFDQGKIWDCLGEP
jgi:glutaryl-CoA dehydrogenase